MIRCNAVVIKVPDVHGRHEGLVHVSTQHEWFDLFQLLLTMLMHTEVTAPAIMSLWLNLCYTVSKKSIFSISMAHKVWINTPPDSCIDVLMRSNVSPHFIYSGHWDNQFLLDFILLINQGL